MRTTDMEFVKHKGGAIKEIRNRGIQGAMVYCNEKDGLWWTSGIRCNFNPSLHRYIVYFATAMNGADWLQLMHSNFAARCFIAEMQR